MRVNLENKSIDLEARDIHFVLGAYIRSYLFASQNQNPEKIIVPMFPSVLHPRDSNVQIPIEWIPATDPFAEEVAEDGSDVAEVTPEQEAALDTQDEVAKELKEQVANLQTDAVPIYKSENVVAESEVVVEEKVYEKSEGTKSAAKASMERLKQSDRLPKQPPGGDLGTGHADNLSSRDIRADKQIARDLVAEADVAEEKEIPAEIEKPAE